MKEDEARLEFQSGNSAFQINYPFIYASAGEEAPDFQKKIGFARYPAVEKGKKSAPPIGGFNIGVGKYSKNPDLAFEAATAWPPDESQLIANEKGGLPPTTEALFTCEGVAEGLSGLRQAAARVAEGRRAAARPPRPTTTCRSPSRPRCTRWGARARTPVPADLRDKLKTVDEGGIF